MKITELLNKLNQSDRFEDCNYSIVIFSDNSGRIIDSTDEELIYFDSYDEMQYKLNELHEQLQEDIKIKFEL
jgi:hypothetical protein